MQVREHSALSLVDAGKVVGNLTEREERSKERRERGKERREERRRKEGRVREEKIRKVGQDYCRIKKV